MSNNKDHIVHLRMDQCRCSMLTRIFYIKLLAFFLLTVLLSGLWYLGHWPSLLEVFVAFAEFPVLSFFSSYKKIGRSLWNLVKKDSAFCLTSPISYLISCPLGKQCFSISRHYFLDVLSLWWRVLVFLHSFSSLLVPYLYLSKFKLRPNSS